MLVLNATVSTIYYVNSENAFSFSTISFIFNPWP